MLVIMLARTKMRNKYMFQHKAFYPVCRHTGVAIDVPVSVYVAVEVDAHALIISEPGLFRTRPHE